MARNPAAFATSLGVAKRPRGIRDLIWLAIFSGISCDISVAVYPGAIVFAVMLYFADSSATVFVKAVMPP